MCGLLIAHQAGAAIGNQVGVKEVVLGGCPGEFVGCLEHRNVCASFNCTRSLLSHARLFAVRNQAMPVTMQVLFATVVAALVTAPVRCDGACRCYQQ
jgi:hypothetical protein